MKGCYIRPEGCGVSQVTQRPGLLSGHVQSWWISQSWSGWNRVSGAFDTSGAVKYSCAIALTSTLAWINHNNPINTWKKGMNSEEERDDGETAEGGIATS